MAGRHCNGIHRFVALRLQRLEARNRTISPSVSVPDGGNRIILHPVAATGIAAIQSLNCVQISFGSGLRLLAWTIRLIAVPQMERSFWWFLVPRYRQQMGGSVCLEPRQANGGFVIWLQGRETASGREPSRWRK